MAGNSASGRARSASPRRAPQRRLGRSARRALKGKGPTPRGRGPQGAPGGAPRRGCRAATRRDTRPSARDRRTGAARRPQPGRRGAAGEGAGNRAVRRPRHRVRRADHRGGPDRRQPRHLAARGEPGRTRPAHRRLACTRASRCRCRRIGYRAAAATCSPPRTRRPLPPLLVALDGVTDPRNLGAVDPLGAGLRRARRDRPRTALGRA